MANVQRIIAWLTVSHLLVMFAVAPVRGEATGPPAFRGVLKADEYAARFEKALQALPSVQQLESSRMPLTGRLVIRILRGHQAEGLNIQVGDVLTAIDDHPIGAYDKQWLFRTDSPQTMRLVTRDGVERAFEIQPGLVGVRHVPYDRPDLAYIRRTDRVREVDEQVLVGIVSARTDPDLSETAWYHAVAGGYEPDALSSACGALIALCQGRSQTAAAYAEHVPEFNPDLPNPLAPRDRLQVAVASGRLDMLLAMSALEQEIVELNVDSIRSLSEEAGAYEAPEVWPIETAATMRRKDLMARVRMYDDSLVSRDELAGGKPFRIHARAGRCDEGYFGFQSPARDVELAVRFKIAMQPQQTQYANIFQVALVDRDYLQRNRLIEESDKPLEVWQQKAILMVGVARDADGASQVYMSFGNRIGSYWNDTPAVDLSSPREFEFRLVRVGDFAEAQIDGVTVVRTPVPQSTRHHAVYMNIGGADVTVDSIHFSALEAAE